MARILVVDDSVFQRKMLYDILAPAGFEVVQAADGEKALESIRIHPPDCVLTDLLMPRMDGFTFLEKLSEMPQPPPAIVVSADIQVTSRDRCVGLGVADFLAKPHRKDDVLAAVARVLCAQAGPVSCD